MPEPTVTPRPSRFLTIFAVIGVVVTMAGTGMMAAEVKIGNVIRVFGLSTLLAVGVAFVGKSFFLRQIETLARVARTCSVSGTGNHESAQRKCRYGYPATPLEDSVRRQMNAHHYADASPQRSIYIRFLVIATRVLGFLILVIAAILFSEALFSFAMQGFRYRRYGGRAFFLVEFLATPLIAAAIGLFVLCVAEILNCVTILSMAAPARQIQHEEGESAAALNENAHSPRESQE